MRQRLPTRSVIMPSAQKLEFDELARGKAEPDLYSLLREIRTANVSTLNSLHRRGTVLFAEGEAVRGVYILRTGSATISISSSVGRVVILRMAHPGDVLVLDSS